MCTHSRIHAYSHTQTHTYSHTHSHSLEAALASPTIPPEIVTALLNLAEFMEHDDKQLPLDTRTLGALAEKCHAFAKALHYKVSLICVCVCLFESSSYRSFQCNKHTLPSTLTHAHTYSRTHTLLYTGDGVPSLSPDCHRSTDPHQQPVETTRSCCWSVDIRTGGCACISTLALAFERTTKLSTARAFSNLIFAELHMDEVHLPFSTSSNQLFERQASL